MWLRKNKYLINWTVAFIMTLATMLCLAKAVTTNISSDMVIWSSFLGFLLGVTLTWAILSPLLDFYVSLIKKLEKVLTKL